MKLEGNKIVNDHNSLEAELWEKPEFVCLWAKSMPLDELIEIVELAKQYYRHANENP